MEKIVIGSQGLLLGKIKVRGKAVHSTIKWQGINAIEKMIRIIDELGRLEKEWSYTVREQGLGPATISVGRIDGGTEVNCIPEECEVYFNVIYLPVQSDEKGRGTKVKQEIEERIKRACQGDAWLAEHPAEITWLNEITPSVIDQNHDLVKIMKTVAQEALENDVEVGMGELPSMSRIMNDMANMPMIMFGPGSIEQAHTVDEWCSVDQYLQAVKILAMFIVQWCGISDN
jgi:acetylornithine deacetylase